MLAWLNRMLGRDLQIDPAQKAELEELRAQGRRCQAHVENSVQRIRQTTRAEVPKGEQA